MDIKRIICRNNLNTIKERLIPENEQIEVQMKSVGISEYVVLPLKFTQRDAVFLHQLKYNSNVWKKVRKIHNIIGISEPNLDPINLILQPKRKINASESIESQDFLTVRQYVPPNKIEDLNLTHDPVNNLTTLILLERLERIGNLVIINKI